MKSGGESRMQSDIIIAVHAAQATANMFGEPAVVMQDLSIKRESELTKDEIYLEKIRPDTCWRVD